jgi:integrase
LKNLLDRLERFHQHRGRRRAPAGELHGHARPCRDRAIVCLLLATGLRREELVTIDLDQLTPNTPAALRASKKAKLAGVRGKGRTQRNVFLSADARTAVADYLDASGPPTPAARRQPCSCPRSRSAPAAQTGGCPRARSTLSASRSAAGTTLSTPIQPGASALSDRTT